MVESSIGHIRDLPHNATEVPADAEAGALGAPRRERRPRVRAALRRRPEEEVGRQRPEGEAQERRRAPARDRRRPRRRGDRLAPRRGAAAEGAGEADGLPRDHEAGDRARARRDPRHRRPARRRAGDPPHPRPPLRLRGLSRPLAEGDEGPLRRPRPVGRDAARRRARARADRVPRRRVLGHRRHVRPRRVRRAAHRRRRPAGRPGPRLRPQRDAPDRGRGPARRGRRALARRGARGGRVRGPLGRAQALHAPPGRAVHHLDAAAGGEPQAPLHGAAHDARRPAALRERLHHLHAHRLDLARRERDRGGALRGHDALRRRLDPGGPAPLQPEGEERAGGARGDPPGRRQLPRARRRAGRGRARRGGPVRPDLEAHGRLADGRRPRRDRLGQGRRDRDRRPATPSSAPPAR